MGGVLASSVSANKTARSGGPFSIIAGKAEGFPEDVNASGSHPEHPDGGGRSMVRRVSPPRPRRVLIGRLAHALGHRPRPRHDAVPHGLEAVEGFPMPFLTVLRPWRVSGLFPDPGHPWRTTTRIPGTMSSSPVLRCRE